MRLESEKCNLELVLQFHFASQLRRRVVQRCVGSALAPQHVAAGRAWSSGGVLVLPYAL